MTTYQPLEPAAVELIEGWPLYDNAIVGHGFAPSMRDYDVVVEVSASAPGGQRSYLEGRYRFRFTHCVVAETTTELTAEAWRAAWDEVFTDYAAWEAAGHPDGYVWGVEYLAAYPGASYVADSVTAGEWSVRLERPMHEVRIATNAQAVRLVFHAVRIHKVAQGDPDSGTLTSIDPVDLLASAT